MENKNVVDNTKGLISTDEGLERKLKIDTSKQELSKPVKAKEMNDSEINEISAILMKQLELHGGIGLSANQLGLNARVCVINVKEPLVLVNPVITKRSEETVLYGEKCLSIPKSMRKTAKTIRNKSITVETDNLGTVEFSSDMNRWKNKEEFFNDIGLLETVCAQHEIDHLDGILMNDATRKYSTTIINERKFGRNEKVMVKLPDGKTEFMKYKHAKKLSDSGINVEIL